MGTVASLVIAAAIMFIVGEVTLMRIRWARRELNHRRADAVKAHAIRLSTLDERREKLLQLQKAQEPFDQLERYAGRMRDANEVHRHRERVLVVIADAAKVAVNGAFVQRDRLHPTAHVKLEHLDALRDALKSWGGTVIAVPGEVAREKSNNLSGPSEEPEEVA